MQDRGSGGCVPGRQGSTSTETRGCAHCGQLMYNNVNLSLGELCEFYLIPPNAGKLQTHFRHNFGGPVVVCSLVSKLGLLELLNLFCIKCLKYEY